MDTAWLLGNHVHHNAVNSNACFWFLLWNTEICDFSNVWHSKADKIVNNFHGQNLFQFRGKTLIFMVKHIFLRPSPSFPSLAVQLEGLVHEKLGEGVGMRPTQPMSGFSQEALLGSSIGFIIQCRGAKHCNNYHYPIYCAWQVYRLSRVE